MSCINTPDNFSTFTTGNWYFVHLLEKGRYFVRPKTLLCFRGRVRGRPRVILVLGLGLGLAEIRFQSNSLSSKCSK